MSSDFPGKNYSGYSGSIPKKMWKFPSALFNDSDGLVACACWNSHTTWGWKRSGFLVILTTGLLMFGIFAPYMASMVLQRMPAFLPFISQSAGSPPMSGIFTVSLSVMAFIYIWPFYCMYESLNHRLPDGSKRTKCINKLAFIIIITSMLGVVITIANPVGYTQVPSKFEWLVAVLMEHGLGAGMVLVGAALYQFLLTRLFFLLPDASKKAKYFKLAVSVSYLILFAAILKPGPTHMREEMGPDPFNIELLKSIKYELPLVFSISYKICAICEWLLVIISGLNLISIYYDLQRVSFRVVLRHKSCYKDILEPAPSITLNSLP